MEFSSLLFNMIHMPQIGLVFSQSYTSVFFSFVSISNQTKVSQRLFLIWPWKTFLFCTNCTGEKLFLTFFSAKHAHWHVKFDKLNCYSIETAEFLSAEFSSEEKPHNNHISVGRCKDMHLGRSHPDSEEKNYN